MSQIVNFLKLVVWGQILPWLGIFWTVFLFFGWGRRKMQRENEKLRLEIERLKRQESILHLPTDQEIESVLRQTERFRKGTSWSDLDRGKSLFNRNAVEDFAGDLHAYLYRMLRQRRDTSEPKSQITDPDPISKRWLNVRPMSVGVFEPEMIEEIDLLFSLLRTFERDTHAAKAAKELAPDR